MFFQLLRGTTMSPPVRSEDQQPVLLRHVVYRPQGVEPQFSKNGDRVESLSPVLLERGVRLGHIDACLPVGDE